MHKYWLVFNALELAQIANEWAQPRNDREMPPTEAPVQRTARNRAVAAPARFRFDTEPGIPNNLINDNLVSAQFRVYATKQDALDFINEITRFQPTAKWTLLESCAFFEVPPTSPVMKSWNEAGELS